MQINDYITNKNIISIYLVKYTQLKRPYYHFFFFFESQTNIKRKNNGFFLSNRMAHKVIIKIDSLIDNNSKTLVEIFEATPAYNRLFRKQSRH